MLLNICGRTCDACEWCPGQVIGGPASGRQGLKRQGLVQELEARRTGDAPFFRRLQTCQQTSGVVRSTSRGRPHSVGMRIPRS